MKPDYIIWKITESEEELLAQLSHPELFADKIQRLKAGSRRMLEVLAVRRALKELLYGEEREVLYTEDGAPYLEGGPYLSISHTDGYAAVITSDVPTGIDIERIGQRVQKVVSHFLRREEQVVLNLATENCQLPAINYQLCLHLAWSAKEAAFKILGKAFYDLQNRTTVQHIDWSSKILILAAEGQTIPLQIHFDFTDEYVLTWVQQKE